MTTARKTLVTGGVRSGKSTRAEALLAGASSVVYVAPGPTVTEDADPDWAARIATHQARRPAHWTTLETRDLAGAVRAAQGAVLIDCLGTWLAAVMDDGEAWDAERDVQDTLVFSRLDELLLALDETPQSVVLVTNEVGLGIVPEHRSGRVFRDLLGVINQRVAEHCDDVLLVVAGRVLRL